MSERSYGGVFATIGDATEEDQRLNGMEVELKDVYGKEFSGKIGVVYLTLVNRKTGIVQIWANMKEAGCALHLSPDSIEVVNGPEHEEHERLLAELLAEMPFRSKEKDDALDAIALREFSDSKYGFRAEDVIMPSEHGYHESKRRYHYDEYRSGICPNCGAGYDDSGNCKVKQCPVCRWFLYPCGATVIYSRKPFPGPFPGAAVGGKFHVKRRDTSVTRDNGFRMTWWHRLLSFLKGSAPPSD